LSDRATALLPLPTRQTAADCVVIGAGIVGCCIALRLQQAGRQVLLLDRSGIAAEASRGNAGACAYSDILPLASPGIVRQAPHWLMDPLGPLSIRPRYLAAIAPWLWRFWRASQPARVADSTRAQAALMQLAAPAMRRLVRDTGTETLLHSDGNLHLYESEAEWQASLPGWEVRSEYGIAFEHLRDPQAIAHWQPGLSRKLVAGVYVPHWQRIDDPLRLTEQVARTLARLGGRLHRAHVVQLRPGPAGVHLQQEGGSELLAQHVVVAAGAWSHRLARSLGQQIPLETERGYNTTLRPGAFPLQRQLTFSSHGFVVTPIAGGVRVGGAVELGGLRAPPDYRRAQVMLEKAQRFMPALKVDAGTTWMGFRPSLPDSLPVIGPAPGETRVTYAFGHGHLGLTQSAATAELVTQLLGGERPSVDLQPFAAARFLG
jgi:D-amino-acid dehydrogenase